MRLLLAKINPRQRMQDLCERGTVFMRRLCASTTIESTVVGDPNEGLLVYYSDRNPTLKVSIGVGDKDVPIGVKSLRVNSSVRDHAVYCMSAFEVPGDGDLDLEAPLTPFLRDKRMREFGDTLVLLKGTPEFIRRFESAALNVGYRLDHGLVEYVQPGYCGEMGPFRKIGGYSYQCEWRFVTTEPIPDHSLTLTLGSLCDIATWIDLRKVFPVRESPGQPTC